jgi:integrase
MRAMASKALTQFALNNLKPKDGDYEVSDGRSGLRVLVRHTGTRTWIVRTRADGKLFKATLGNVDAIKLKDARTLASKVILKAGEGVNVNKEKKKAREAKRDAAKNTLKAICEEYMSRECGMRRDDDGVATFSGAGKLRSAESRLKTFERLVYPELGHKPIDDVRRTDVVRMLDKIEDESGPRMADMVLAIVRRVMNWHAARSDTYRSPIVRGMARHEGKPRERILSDDELRAVWKAAGDAALFGSMVKFILLTAARRDEAAKMKLTEVDGADWTLPAARNKTKLDLIRPLPKAAQELLAKVTRIEGCPYVFSNDGVHAVGGYGKFKAALQEASGTAGWSLHDLRRTARSLMSRAGVPSDHAEHVMGHVLPGMRKVYDRHDYHDEKELALARLATLIETIINPLQDNVITEEELAERRALRR